jgi:hypothetical protein
MTSETISAFSAHFGIIVRPLDEWEVAAIKSLPGVVNVWQDGDSWLEWGETRRTGERYHLVIEVDDKAAMPWLTKWLYRMFGGITGPTLTTVKDWSVVA